MQYSSSLKPFRAKRTSATLAAGRSDTPSPMKTMRGIVPSSQVSVASSLASLTESSLSWPSSVSCLQIGFQLLPSSEISASFATIWICALSSSPRNVSRTFRKMGLRPAEMTLNGMLLAMQNLWKAWKSGSISRDYGN